jgi:hypothetical protein
MVHNIWLLHNSVNGRNGKPDFSIELLRAFYVDRTRSDIMSEIGRVLRDINTEWEPFVSKQLTGAAFREWRNDVALLTGLLAGGPN